MTPPLPDSYETREAERARADKAAAWARVHRLEMELELARRAAWLALKAAQDAWEAAHEAAMECDPVYRMQYRAEMRRLDEEMLASFADEGRIAA